MSDTSSTIKVFVSSTSRDLIHHREAVQKAIIARGMLPIMMEFFSANSAPPLSAVRQELDASDVLIGIYAKRYGYCPPEHDISITEMEYNWAQENNIDCLLFVLDSDEGFPPRHPIRTEADNDPRLQKFLGRISEIHTWQKFGEPEDLAMKVSLALEKWENSRKPQSPAVELPFWTQIVRAMLSGLTLLVVISFLLNILEAGPTVVSAFSGLLGLLFALLPLLSSYTGKFKPFEPLVKSKYWKWGVISLQFIVLIVTFFALQYLTDVLAENQLDEAFRAGSVSEAINALDAAEALGADVETAVEDNLYTFLDNSTFTESQTATVLRNAELYDAYAPEDEQPEVARELTEQAQSVAANDEFERALLLTQATAIIDPEIAGTLVSQFNDTATEAFVRRPPDLTEARQYFELVRQIDLSVNTGRTPEQKSISRYNLAVVTEQQSASDRDELTSAVTFYDEALELNDGNIEARYALSSLLLIEFSENEAQLRRAAELAEQGHELYIDSQYCAGPQNLEDETIFLNSWYCFLLRTTEAGALIALGDETNEATGLIERATRLAEANNQFGTGNYTAEAYYYKALLTAPESDCDTLFQIITNRDTSNSRHQEWAIYANTQIEDQDCSFSPS